MWNWLEFFARIIFCTPQEEAPLCDKTHKSLRMLSITFDLLDFVDSILDLIASIHMMKNGRIPGFFLFFGIVSARLVAVLGELYRVKQLNRGVDNLIAQLWCDTGYRVLMRGGLQWAPFFQDRREFYDRVGPDSVLPRLFAILFTEIAIFMLEDATLYIIWITTDSFDKDNVFDRLNAWVSLASMVLCIILLLVSVVTWLKYCKWKPDWCSRVCQLLSGLGFLFIFGATMAMLVYLVYSGIQVVVGDERVEENETKNSLLRAAKVMWKWISRTHCMRRRASRMLTPYSWRAPTTSMKIMRKSMT